MKTWISIPKDSDFSIHNIPFGIISLDGKRKKVATRVGDQILDLEAVAKLGLF